ncbi:MAG: inositol monophosphatase [Holosporales bacterium]|jgi:myo-inositol-1(or 4)-monophosphatase|nr:inositol monophosphatase [Holosporales bacterium]
MGDKAAYLNIMRKAAEKASVSIIRDFGELEKLQVSKKGFQNFVTNADRRAEETIVYSLAKAHPDISFICEERGEELNSRADLVWIVDPIDGTTNFMRGVSYFAISIALSERTDIVAGITLDPIRNECFIAEKGSGAFVGSRNRIRVSGRTNTNESLMAVHLPSHLEASIVKTGAIIRKMGSIALDLAHVAAGRYEASICKNVMIWDIATGILLVQEAGGFVKYKKYTDGSYDIIAASSLEILNNLCDCCEWMKSSS